MDGWMDGKSPVARLRCFAAARRRDAGDAGLQWTSMTSSPGAGCPAAAGVRSARVPDAAACYAADPASLSSGSELCSIPQRARSLPPNFDIHNSNIKNH